MTDSYSDNAPMTGKPIPASANILNTSLCTKVRDKTRLMQQSIGNQLCTKMLGLEMAKMPEMQMQ